MDMSLLARNVTFARTILRIIVSLCFLMGLSKPVVIQTNCTTSKAAVSNVAVMDTNDADVFQVVSHLADELFEFSTQGELSGTDAILEIAGDEYWQYHLDCDRWGVVLATPTEHTGLPEIQKTIDSFENNSIADTLLAAQIAVPRELQEPAQEQSVIDFLISLEIPLVDRTDALLLAAEQENPAEAESDSVPQVNRSNEPLTLNAAFKRALIPELEQVVNEDDSSEVAAFETASELLEQPSFDILSMINTSDSLYDFGDLAVHQYIASDAEFVEENNLGPICNLDFDSLDLSHASNGQTELASPLPSLAYGLFREALRSPIWYTPESTLAEIRIFLQKQYGGTLLYQMSEDVMFNIEMDLDRNHDTDDHAAVNPAELYRWTAGQLNWMAFQLQNAANSISRTANAVDAELR